MGTDAGAEGAVEGTEGAAEEGAEGARAEGTEGARAAGTEGTGTGTGTGTAGWPSDMADGPAAEMGKRLTSSAAIASTHSLSVATNPPDRQI